MFAEPLTDEYMASLEADVQAQAGRVEDVIDWTDGIIADVDQPDYVWKNPRISERTDLENGRQVYSILCDDGQEVDLKALIAKLNKKLGKWGQTINIVSEEVSFKTHWLRKGAWKVSDNEVSETPSAIARREGYGDRQMQVRQVLLTIDSPAVAGKKTKLIGSFELAEDGVNVYRHALNGATSTDIEPFLARWRDCDHCRFKRSRKSSFICEDEQGRRAVIGRQCSRDFLGLDAAELLAREAIRKTLSAGGEDDEDERISFGIRYIHVETFVQRAYLVAKRLGGYSREMREEFLDHLAALEGAKDYGRDRHYTDLRAGYVEWMQKAKPEPLDFHAFADYIFGATGDFGENLRIAFSCEWAKPKRRTLLAAGVGLYIGRLLKQAKATVVDTRPPAKHLDAAEGKRVDFVGTVERTIPLPSDFGIKTLIAILAPDGSRCVHYCTSEVQPEAGKRYAIRATIKRHENRSNFGPQTVITRAVYSPASDEPTLL